MRQQAAHFGAAELSRAADIVNAGLTEMRGATAPRLQLELICARVLLPAAEDTERGVAARLDRLERRADIAGAPRRRPLPPTGAGPAYAGRRRPPSRRPRPPVEPPPAAATAAAAAEPRRPPRAGRRAAAAQPTAEPAAAAAAEPAAQPPAEPRRPPAGRRPGDRAPAVAGGARGGQGACAATPGRCSATTPRSPALGRRPHHARLWSTPAPRDSFLRGGSDEIVREALIQVLGVDWKVDAIVDPSTAPTGRRPPRPQARR